ncbi:MAG: TA system VapC family ribonuclease toxin [Blastocatellales bacterium]
MILPDANLLLYAYNSSTPEHEKARIWWENALNSPETVGLSWQTTTAFLRISTNPRAFSSPFTIDEATSFVSEWLERPMVMLAVPGDRHWTIFQRLVKEAQCTGHLVMDAHLAALALELGATLYTHDRDFNRFSGVSCVDPLM